jgi:heparan-alpha-glucosaminide N-acetyltransferase
MNRIVSLDWVRGWMLIASVAANSLLATPPWFDHARWDGVHLLDWIFPVFVTLSGCGLAFAMHRRVKPWPLVRRVLVLVLAGLLYNALTQNVWDPDVWTFTGVLQLYALVVLVLGLLHLLTRSWLGWLIVTVVLAAGYTVVLAVWAAGCGDAGLTETCNPSGVVDPAVFGAAHIYHHAEWGYDPVGLMAAWGALVSASAGATMGHLLVSVRDRRPTGGEAPTGGLEAAFPLRHRDGVTRAVLPLLACAAGALLLAQLCVWLPEWIGGAEVLVMKRLWTPPFALRLVAPVALALLIGHLLLDRRSENRIDRIIRGASYPLIALGRNSLLVYFGSHTLMSVLHRPIEVVAAGAGPDGAEVVIETSVADELARSIAIGGQVQLTWSSAVLLFWILLACVLHRARLYLRP